MALRGLRVSTFAAAAMLLGGCVSDGVGPAASLTTNGPVTIAFESVDGPPPAIFDRLVGALDSEAKLRGIPVVSREGGATYRVRSYLSAQVRGKRTIIAWVWDVYDAGQQRALRLSGEEAGSSGRGDAWSAADDTVLRRVAQAGLSGLAGMLSPTRPVPPPRADGPAIAENAAAPPMTLGFNAR